MCNLASIALNRYVRPDKTYDFRKLVEVTKVIVRNLNKIIDVNYYPVPEVGHSAEQIKSIFNVNNNKRSLSYLKKKAYIVTLKVPYY